jgi:hypothetical protein
MGVSHAILTLAELGFLNLVVCPYVLEEAERNIKGKLAEGLSRYQEMIGNIRWEIIPDPGDDLVKPWLTLIVPKDAPISYRRQ